MAKRLLILFTALFCCELSLFSQSESVSDSSRKSKKETPNADTSSVSNKEIYKPTIGLGTGMLSFVGGMKGGHFQLPWTARIGYELIVTQPLNKSFYMNFYGLFGKLGVNQRSSGSNLNFQTEIRTMGVNLMYDFSDFIDAKKYKCRPWISTGFEYFEFLSKTDLYDRNGNKYFYWSDGSIKNMAQGSPGSQNAINLVRDYTYESDIREMNPYGFGKYQEYSFAVPVGAGFLFHLNDRVDFKMGTTFHFTFTDYIDGGSNKFTGNKSKDKFMMTSFSLHYDLVTKKKDDTLSPDHFKDVDFYALEMEDEDGDGVRDFDDMCHETPKGVKVDAKGCPLDEDGDGIPDYRDDELPTPKSMIANGRGVGITDAMAQLWYDTFYDSTGIFAKQVDLDSARNAPKENLANKQREYTVELAKFKGGVPNDVMTFLLSIGDIRSTTIGDTTIVYTAGSYEDVRTAVRRKDEFVSEGVKDAKVGYFQGGKYNELSKDELGKEIAKANEKSGNNGNEETNHVPGAIIYRIQLGAFKNKLSPNVFKNAGKVLELKTDDGFYRYVSGAHKTLNSAAAQRADLVFEGYPDAWITAYKNGKRISLTEAGATYENKNDSKQENLNDSKNSSSSVDKNLIAFRLQLGIKKDSDLGFKDRIKDLKGVEKQVMSTGDTRYLLEKNYSDYNEAMKVKAEMNTNGFPEVIVIATFKGEIIPTLDALELLTK